MNTKQSYIFLIRYANTIPLLDLPIDISSCLLYHALRTFNWGAFGHRVRNSNNGGIGNIVGELISLNEEQKHNRVLIIIVDVIMSSGMQQHVIQNYYLCSTIRQHAKNRNMPK